MSHSPHRLIFPIDYVGNVCSAKVKGTQLAAYALKDCLDVDNSMEDHVFCC